MKKVYNELFDETFYTEELANGLRVVIFHKPDFLTTSCAFGTKYGALSTNQIFNNKEYHFNPGVAHFLEHKLFESKEKDVFTEFSNMGCNVNAFTSYHETVYYFSMSNNDIKEPLNLLLDFVQDLDIDEKSVEKEKGIIIQELSMYLQNPDSRLLQEAYRSMYKEYPLKYDIGGDDKTVTAISKDELELCYRLNYHPNNMALVITSPLDPKSIMDIVKENQAKKSFDDNIIVSNILNKEPLEVNRKDFTFKMDINKAKHLYAIKLKPDFKDKNDVVFKEWCMNIYLKAYFSSLNPSYQNWLDKGIINDYFGYDVDFDKEYAYLLFYNESDNDNLKELIDNELLKDLLNDDILTQLKRRYVGMAFETFNDIENFNLGYIRDYLNDGDYFKAINILMDISLDDLKAVYKSFDYSNYALIHILPCGK